MSDYSNFCGIDLAINHFSIHAVDQHGKVLLHKSVTRSKLLTTIANMPAMRIGLEACGGAHYWARTLRKLGHASSLRVEYLTANAEVSHPHDIGLFLSRHEHLIMYPYLQPVPP